MSARSATFEVPPGPVLVIAPHPDDETLGCGGLIAQCVRNAHPVHTVFVTDGGASHPGSRAWSRQRLAAQREAEAEEALRRLGAGDEPRSFLRLADADMPGRATPAYAEAVASIAGILDALEPRFVVLPWRRDPHCDHRASWSLGMEAVSACNRSPDVLEYSIWLDELGEPGDHPEAGEMERISLAVSSDVKRYALLAHRSQLGELVLDDPTGFVLGPETDNAADRPGGGLLAAMQRAIIDPAGFEAKFRENIDPWNYAASPFEAYKRTVLLHACGTRPFGRGLELACAIGETTRMLAPRCLRLLAVDSSATALKEAARGSFRATSFYR